MSSVALCTLVLLAVSLAAQSPDEWPAYGRDAAGTKYSPLAQINRGNVARLRVAWTFRTGDMYDPEGKGGRRTAFECAPLYVRAFDVETGRELWKGKLPTSARATPMTYRSRGRQYVVIAAGGHDVAGIPMGDHLVAFALE